MTNALLLAHRTVAMDVTGKINQRVAELLSSSQSSPA